MKVPSAPPLRVNLDGTFLGCRYAIRAMKARGTGSIINISSRFGLVGIPGAAAYASSKAAVRNHTKTVALYCAQQGWAIRCNSPSGGHPDGDVGAHAGDRPRARAADRGDRRGHAAQALWRPEEVAALALLPSSDEASYMTGAELNVDGGLLAGSAAVPGRS